jgi:hypothetical protein
LIFFQINFVALLAVLLIWYLVFGDVFVFIWELRGIFWCWKIVNLIGWIFLEGMGGGGGWSLVTFLTWDLTFQ